MGHHNGSGGHIEWAFRCDLPYFTVIKTNFSHQNQCFINSLDKNGF